VQRFVLLRQFAIENPFKCDDHLLNNPKTFKNSLFQILEERLKEFSLTIACKCCRSHITTQKQVFVMSNTGVSGNYVNTHGYNHEMITVKKCWNVWYQGNAETEYR
jgi:hypothetical protein